jgi:adenosylcobalamin-dependent ribonucleoside-triphosphate reductase
MSNNSIAFQHKPTREYLHKIFQIMKDEGEPAFVNMETAQKRRPNAKGLNPCGEVLLDSYGVCNLTTVNVMGFVTPEYNQELKEDAEIIGYHLDYQGLMQAQALSVRAGMRMTCLDLELPHWDKVQKRDRLIGCSITGWKDAMSALGYSNDQANNLLYVLADVAHAEGIRYANSLRIPMPLLDTTVKPEGTLSQVANGVSSGVHDSFAPYYIRRIRINANDPLADVAWKLEWNIHPEVGTPPWQTPRTWVIDFPVKSGASKTRADVSALEQLENYFNFQDIYTAHNSSNTIHVKEDEWDAVEQMIWDRWDDFIGVTFIPFDGGTYELAPYEEITEEEYNKLKSNMKPFAHGLLYQIEKHAVGEETLDGADGCESGACPIR